jgi:alginate O-acetyltransferase complex protein AlgI
VVWGTLHGSVLVLERFFKNRGWDILRFNVVKWAFTFLLVNVAWVFFRAHSLADAFLWLSKVFMVDGSASWEITYIAAKHKDRFFAALLVALPVAVFAKNTWEIQFKPKVRNAVILALLFVICLTYMGEESPFLYFQF